MPTIIKFHAKLIQKVEYPTSHNEYVKEFKQINAR